MKLQESHGNLMFLQPLIHSTYNIQTPHDWPFVRIIHERSIVLWHFEVSWSSRTLYIDNHPTPTPYSQGICLLISQYSFLGIVDAHSLCFRNLLQLSDNNTRLLTWVGTTPRWWLAQGLLSNPHSKGGMGDVASMMICVDQIGVPGINNATILFYILKTTFNLVYLRYNSSNRHSPISKVAA